MYAVGASGDLLLFSALRIPTQDHSGGWLTTETYPLLFSLLPRQGQGLPADSMLTYVPAARTRHPMGHPLQTLSRLQPGELSPEAGGGAQKRTLLRQLIAYLAMIPPSPTQAGPLMPYDLVRMSWRKQGKRFSPPEDPTEPLGTGDGKSAPPPLGLFVINSVFPAPAALCLGGVDARHL